MLGMGGCKMIGCALDCEFYLSLVSGRQRNVLVLRAEGYYLHEIGEIIGVTAERVRQIEDWALRKIRREICKIGDY